MTYGNYPNPQSNPYGAGYPPSAPPDNHLVWAILTTLFCCLPFGIVSIVFAAQVNSKWTLGDYQGAIASSQKAKTWAITAAVCGGIGIVIYGIIIAVVASKNGGLTPTSP
jgi:heme/copper-type cytochrome/quinol oxidase subunit 2